MTRGSNREGTGGKMTKKLAILALVAAVGFAAPAVLAGTDDDGGCPCLNGCSCDCGCADGSECTCGEDCVCDCGCADEQAACACGNSTETARGCGMGGCGSGVMQGGVCGSGCGR